MRQNCVPRPKCILKKIRWIKMNYRGRRLILFWGVASSRLKNKPTNLPACLLLLCLGWTIVIRTRGSFIPDDVTEEAGASLSLTSPRGPSDSGRAPAGIKQREKKQMGGEGILWIFFFSFTQNVHGKKLNMRRGNFFDRGEIFVWSEDFFLFRKSDLDCSWSSREKRKEK